MSVVSKSVGKFEQVYITGDNSVMYFAYPLTKPQPKPKSDDKQYSVTVFVDTETREKLENPVEDGGVFINKQLFEVGVEKNKKKKVKFPTSDQVGEDEYSFDDVKGMHGVSLTAPEFKKNGDRSVVNIVDKDGKPWDKSKSIGNGTKANFRMWGYRNEEGQLNVTLDLVQIVEWVEGSSGGGNGGFDDVLGIDLSKSETPAAMEAPTDFDDEDSDIPF